MDGWFVFRIPNRPFQVPVADTDRPGEAEPELRPAVQDRRRVREGVDQAQRHTRAVPGVRRDAHP